MGVFMKANTNVTEQNGEVFRQSHRYQRPESLRTVSPRNALSLAWVPFSCSTIVWTRFCQSELPDTRENFSSGRVHESHLLPLHQGEVFFQRVFLKVEAISHE